MSCPLRRHRISIASLHSSAHTPGIPPLRILNSMTATPSMQRLWLVVLCLLAVTVPVYSYDGESIGNYQLGPFGSKRWRLDSIRDCLAKIERSHSHFQMPPTEGGLDYELPSNLAVTLRIGFYRPGLTGSGFVHFVKLSDLLTFTKDYDKLVSQVLQECEGWKSAADRLLLDSLSGPDDPGFFTVIDWHANREGW